MRPEDCDGRDNGTELRNVLRIELGSERPERRHSVYVPKMRRKVQVQKLLRNSEARTGKSARFIVGDAGSKIGRLLISLWDADADLEVDLEGGLTAAKEKLILDWFEPLAKPSTASHP